MTEVLPLIVDPSTGQIRQMQPNDTLAVFAKEVNFRNLTSEESVEVIKKCAPVYISSADKVKRANAAAPLSAKVRGLAMRSAVPGAAIPVQADGSFTATKQEWDEVLGVDVAAPGYTPAGLVAQQDYWLSITDGVISTTPPGGSGNSMVYLGTADSPETMDLDMDRPLALS